MRQAGGPSVPSAATRSIGLRIPSPIRLAARSAAPQEQPNSWGVCRSGLPSRPRSVRADRPPVRAPREATAEPQPLDEILPWRSRIDGGFWRAACQFRSGQRHPAPLPGAATRRAGAGGADHSRTGFGSGLAARIRLWITLGGRPAFWAISASCCSMRSRAGWSPSKPPRISIGTRRFEARLPSSNTTSNKTDASILRQLLHALGHAGLIRGQNRQRQNDGCS